mgnify:CR=1 FL=1
MNDIRQSIIELFLDPLGGHYEYDEFITAGAQDRFDDEFFKMHRKNCNWLKSSDTANKVILSVLQRFPKLIIFQTSMLLIKTVY